MFSTTPSVGTQVYAGLLYGGSSLLIIFVNKICLTTYHFPSALFLAFSQFVATILLLVFLKWAKLITFSGFSFHTLRAVFPLPLIFFLNTFTGLAGTKSLNLPMLTVLRRFSIVLTMLAELVLLKVKPSVGVQVGVFMMVAGALVAAMNDLAFDPYGYAYIMLNNVFTAANGVVSKQKLEEKELGVYGVMFYNAIFSLPFSSFTLILAFNNELKPVLDFELWGDPGFLLSFSLSAVMGFVLNFSIVYCTKVNSALTTTVIGSLKNIFSTYLGMFMGDYVFTMANFMGLNISVVGSLVYSHVKYLEQKQKRGSALPGKPELPVATASTPNEKT